MGEYYILRAERNAKLAEVHGPVDATGEPFPEFQKVDPGSRGTCHCVDKRTRLADCVHCITKLIISERAAEIFQKFRMPEGTVFLPAEVCARNGKSIGQLVAVMIPEIVEAVDLTASKFKELTGGMPHYFTAPPVVRAADLKGLDVVQSHYITQCLCSGKLKCEIEKEGLTNFTFEPVVVK